MNKVAVVTGAGSGIGRSIACRFAAEGASVVVNDLDKQAAERTVSEIGAGSGIAVAWQADVAEARAVEALVDETLRRFGRLDVMVNNAAAPLAALVADTDDQTWRRVLSVTLDGTFHGIRASLRVMTRQRSGSIVNIASVAGMGGSVAFGAYGAAKAAVLNLTQTAAVEIASHGVRVNAISPGTIATPPMLAFIDQIGGADAFAKQLPLERIGDPDEVAHVALFLASEESSYVTGANYVVDGGVSARLGAPRW